MLGVAATGIIVMPDLTYLTTLDPARFELKPGQDAMKAVLTTGNGDYDKLDYCDVAIPSIGSAEVCAITARARTMIVWFSGLMPG